MRSLYSVSLLFACPLPMSQGQDFSSVNYWSLSPAERSRILQDQNVPPVVKARLLLQRGIGLATSGQYDGAIACYNQALELVPLFGEAWYRCGLALAAVGYYDEAIACYDKAIEIQPKFFPAWSDRGYAKSILGRHKQGLADCDRAIALCPDYHLAWSDRGYILQQLHRSQEAQQSCTKAVQLNPDSPESWHTFGLVYWLAKSRQAALNCFEKAVDIDPNHAKSWYNRGLILDLFGDRAAALESMEKALLLQPNSQAVWYPKALYGRGYLLAKSHRYPEAIKSFDQALERQQDYAAAAFYKLILLIGTGKIINSLTNRDKRKQLWRELIIIAKTFKYIILIILGFILFNTYAKGVWMTGFQEFFSLLFSVGLISLFLWELWKNKSNLGFVRKIYKRGLLTYLRSLVILLVTLTIFVYVAQIMPPFMKWGWTSAVFGGNSGNLVFQPFNTVQKLQAPTSEVTPEPTFAPTIIPTEKTPTPSVIPEQNLSPQQPIIPPNKPENKNHLVELFRVQYPKVLMGLMWLVLMLLVPFWSNLEEKIFRQGANTWKQILIRSTQFGLVHIVVGIPIYAGFVLIVPGFLFACRYKYVHDKQLKKTNDEKLAQEAGVEASTADHAIYNAILISFVVLATIVANE
jgi:tetratricopeptide (TPR) repeat protein